jgi:hypothetical protein
VDMLNSLQLEASWACCLEQLATRFAAALDVPPLTPHAFVLILTPKRTHHHSASTTTSRPSNHLHDKRWFLTKPPRLTTLQENGNFRKFQPTTRSLLAPLASPRLQPRPPSTPSGATRPFQSLAKLPRLRAPQEAPVAARTPATKLPGL